MQTTVNISLRVPTAEAKILTRAAKRLKQPLATFVREAAVRVAKETTLVTICYAQVTDRTS